MTRFLQKRFTNQATLTDRKVKVRASSAYSGALYYPSLFLDFQPFSLSL